jgi:hypothetical protein
VIWKKIAADRLKVIEDQWKEIEALKRLVKKLSEKISRLEKNSTNSTKSTSSDITKPPKKAVEEGEKRKMRANQVAFIAHINKPVYRGFFIWKPAIKLILWHCANHSFRFIGHFF